MRNTDKRIEFREQEREEENDHKINEEEEEEDKRRNKKKIREGRIRGYEREENQRI